MTLVDGIIEVTAEVDKKLKVLESKEYQYNVMRGRMEMNKCLANSLVTLNVGGQTFTAPKETYLQWDDTYFHTLICGGAWDFEKDGEYFVDRDPKYFSHVMAALRTGQPVDFSGLSRAEAEKLRIELDYYQLPVCLRPMSPRWDANCCGKHIAITDSGRTATLTCKDGSWHSLSAMRPDLPSFKVRLRNLDRDMSVMIGYISRDTFQADGHNKTGSWFLMPDGKHSGGMSVGASKKQRLKQGDLVTVRYRKEASTICFSVNDSSYGTIRLAIDSNDVLLPCVELWGQYASVSLED